MTKSNRPYVEDIDGNKNLEVSELVAMFKEFNINVNHKLIDIIFRLQKIN